MNFEQFLLHTMVAARRHNLQRIGADYEWQVSAYRLSGELIDIMNEENENDKEILSWLGGDLSVS